MVRNLRKRFNEYLDMRGLSQVEFADKIELDPATLSKLMLGNRLASREAAISIHKETDGVISFTHLWGL